ncbi:ThiF family adenylyltransferase [Cupriavidus sp. 2MCAB6]|uniref:ThiF family adenylyltransferase n=1 Tax=Cupriavidus sp. 2MCAB6 TaxID=3232981 RepID=UPI003F8F72EC
MSESAYGRALQVLSAAGLKLVKARGRVRAFEGPLKTASRDVLVRMEIEDWNFLRYPRITLLERPQGAAKVMEHVDALGGLCYFSPGSVILDRFEPDVAILQCLTAARTVLNRIASGTTRSADIANEFGAYWMGGQRPPAYPVMVGELEPDATSASYFLMEQDGGDRKGLIAQDAIAAARVGEGFAAERVAEGALACFLFKSSEAPGVPVEGLPSTIKQFFKWVKSWDAELSKQVQQCLGTDKTYLKRKGCVIAFNTPLGRFGVMFKLDLKHRQGFQNSPREYRNYLHHAGGETAVLRLRLDDISPAYIHSRNLEFSSLAGRRLTLIGCGAIGGYLAQALVRLGAGTGKNGLLRLIDIGEMEPDNLGRHALGFPALYRNKAEALRDELARQFPYVQVETQTTSPTLNAKFFATDLVIDATGDEALNTLVNAAHIERRLGPVLYVRVMGNGECVQALWSDSEKYGCFQCLRQGFGPNYRQERYQVLASPPRTRFRGCSAYTPYAVSTSMSAAALAADMVSDWLRGSVSPRFRTRYLENADAKRIKNQNIAPANNCPACQRH